jgi:hypothetical protein
MREAQRAWMEVFAQFVQAIEIEQRIFDEDEKGRVTG